MFTHFISLHASHASHKTDDVWYGWVIFNTVTLCSCPMSICVHLVFLSCTFSRVCCFCVSTLSFMYHLYPCLRVFPILFFIPISLSDGRSSSQALKEEKEAPPLNPPQSRRGRFQVGAVALILSLPLISLNFQGNVDKQLMCPTSYAIRWLQCHSPLPRRMRHQAIVALTGKWDGSL